MKTVSRALSLLSCFDTNSPELGLSEVARLRNFDKATTLRMLGSLCEHGLLEKDPTSSKYRLGPTILRLASIREATRPVRSLVQPHLQQLANQTGELTHFSLLEQSCLSNLLSIESQHANRVSIAPGEELPLHATSSGLCVLAFSSGATRKRLLQAPLSRFTASTPTNSRQLNQLLQQIGERGFAVGRDIYESSISSVAAPVFGIDQQACGAVSVALPSTRFDRATEKRLPELVQSTAAAITQALGGNAPAEWMAA